MENVLSRITDATGAIAGQVWGIPSILLLVGTGAYLTFRLRFIQLRGLKHSFRLIAGNNQGSGNVGEVTPFQALARLFPRQSERATLRGSQRR